MKRVGEARRRRESHRVGDRLGTLARKQQPLRIFDAARFDVVSDRTETAGAKSTRELAYGKATEIGDLRERGCLSKFPHPVVDQQEPPFGQSALPGITVHGIAMAP